MSEEGRSTMNCDSSTWIIGDIVSRNSDDEHEILEFNATRDLMLVRCIKPDSGGCFSSGVEEWNLPRRYEWVRRTEHERVAAARGKDWRTVFAEVQHEKKRLAEFRTAVASIVKPD